MEWICWLFPACMAMKIRYGRKKKEVLSKNILVEIFCWAEWVLIINILCMIIITYGMRIDNVLIDAFNSFSFSMKYLILAMVLAIVLPYVVEIIEKYIGITVTIEKNEINE